MRKTFLFLSLLLTLAGSAAINATTPIRTGNPKINPNVPRPEPPVGGPKKGSTTGTPANTDKSKKAAVVKYQNLLTGETWEDITFDPASYVLPEELEGFWFITIEQDGQILFAQAVML